MGAANCWQNRDMTASRPIAMPLECPHLHLTICVSLQLWKRVIN